VGVCGWLVWKKMICAVFGWSSWIMDSLY
jgi:hypothetical protein